MKPLIGILQEEILAVMVLRLENNNPLRPWVFFSGRKGVTYNDVSCETELSGVSELPNTLSETNGRQACSNRTRNPEQIPFPSLRCRR